LTVGLVGADSAGSVKTINARGRSLTGWSEQEALGKDLAQVLMLRNSKQVPVTGDLLHAALRGQGEHAPEGLLKLVSKSGGETQVEFKVSPVQDERRQIVGVCLVFWPAGTREREGAPPAPSASESGSDPVTGLPGRAQATALLHVLHEQHPKSVAALFVLDRYCATAHKFGTKLADEVLTYYCTFLAQELHEALGGKGLFRWTGPCLLAIFGPLDSPRRVQREISRCTQVRLEKVFDLPDRTTLLLISGSAAVFSIDDKPLEALISQIDAFVAIQTKDAQAVLE
jgi:PAS domain S-box-containing protein